MNSEGTTFTGINLGPAAGATPPPPGPVPGGPVPASPSGSPYDDLINQAAQENNLDPVIYRAQLMQESGLNPNAVGPPTKYGRAQGIAQFMPAVSKALGIDPMDPEQAIRAGAKMMRGHLNANNESYPMALAAFNWGSGNLKKYGFEKRPPETRKYISNIMGPGSGSPIVVGATPQTAVAPKPPAGGTAGAMAMAPTVQSTTFTGINLGPAPQSLSQPQQPQQPLDQGTTFTGINLGPAAPQQEAPPWYDLRDVPGSLVQGVMDATREAGQLASGQAFTDQPQAQQPQAPRSYVGEAVYGVGHSFPMAATGILGGLGGAAVGGPFGAVAGSALGMGGASALQALVPGFKEGRAQGMNPEQAVDYAYRRALTEGGISAATAPIFGLLELAPVKSAVAKWMLANVVAQPAVGLTTRVVEPMVTGDKPPTAEELLRGAGQDIIAGATFSAGHALANRVLPKAAAPKAPPPPGLRQLIENMRGQLQQQQQAEPGPAVPAAAVQQHAATRMAALKDATTPEDITEREYLTKYANDPAALAQLYGVTVAPDEAVPAAPAQGEAVREPIASAALPAATAPAVSSEDVVPPDQLAGRSQLARGAGDEGGDTRIAARAAGEGILGAEATRTDGHVQSLPGEEGVAARNVLASQETIPARREPTPEEEASIRQNVAARTQELSDAQATIQERTAALPSVERAAEVPAAAPEHSYLQPAADAEPGGSIPQRFVDEAKKTTVEISAPDGRTYKGPIDASGVWFLDGEKPVYFYANPKASLMGPRAAELNKYEKVSAQNGETVWFKPGERLRAEKVLATYSEPGREAEFHRTLGKLLGYSHESVEGFIKNHPGLQEKPPAERAAEATAAPPVEGEKSRELNSGVKSQPTAASELGQAPGQAPGQAERLGQEGQAEGALSQETLPLQKPDQRRVTSPLEDASAPEQGELFRDEQPPAAGEITPEEESFDDTKTAKRPQDQLRLDALNSQLDKLQAQPGDHQDQIAKLTATRDKLLPQDLLARRRVGKQPSKVSTAAPKPLGAEKDFLDYKYQDGTPIYRDAFVEHAMRKLGMSQAGAEAWANNAINLGIHEQVEILRSQVQDKFGFADVKVDDKLSAYDASHLLLDLHRAAQDMMHALGFPVEMASLMGKARLELNAIGKKTPFGSYAPATKTIAIHGRANVFGHEWVHALDHDMADLLLKAQQNPGYLATQLSRRGVLNPADPLTARIANLVNTMFHNQGALALKKVELQLRAQEVNAAGTPTLRAQKAQADLKALETGAAVKGMQIKPSDYRAQSAKYGTPSYWANEAELLARAGEAYIARIMEQLGLDPSGVLLRDEAYLSNTNQRLRMTFPKQQERADIFRAYEHLMDGYRQIALAGSPAAVQAMRGGMSDPKVWGKLFRDPNQMGPFKELVYRLRNKNDTLAAAAITDPSRPDPGGNHAWQRAKAGASATFNSRMGHLEALYETVPQAAKAALQKVMDRLGYTPGKGRYTGWDTIEEEAHGLLHQALSQMTNSMQRAGLNLERLTADQGAQLRHIMTTGESTYPVDPLNPNSRRVPIDARITAAAGPLRVISNDIFDNLRKAGFDISHSKNGHFMRLYDQVRIHSDPVGFTRAAGELYGRMFDDDVGKPGDKPDALLEQWRAISTEERQNADPAVQSGMTALGKNLRRQKEVEEDMAANGVTAARQAEYDQLQRDAEQLALAHHDAVKGQYAELAADDWLKRVRENYAQDFDKTGAGGNFLGKRTLPTYTDQVMRDYMITDPMTVLPRYYESAARKIAYAKRFGVKGEIRSKLVTEMLDGGMHPEDVKVVGKIIDQVAGRTSNSYSRTMSKAANLVHAGAALGLLGRSAYSTLAEPFVIALSHGSMRAGLRSFGAVFGNIMRTASAYERAEVADFIGSVRSRIHEDVLMNRTGADYSDSPMIGKLMAQYYRAIGLTQMTNWNRQAAVAGGDWLLGKYARDILNPSQRAWASDRRDNARRMLNELGVAPELHEEFAQWKASLDGLPDTDTIGEHRFGPSYARAMRRIIDRSVIDPKKIERPMATEDKWIGLLWQFQSFGYGFQRNVIDPMVKRIGRAYEQGAARGGGGLDSMARGGVNAAWEINHTGAIVGAYVGINMLTTMLRQYVFNKDDWDKHEADDTLGEYITDLAMQRSGLGGTLDPITQVITNMRYTQDLSGLLEGPGIKFMAKNFYDVLMGVPGLIQGQPEDNTNTRAHNAVKGLYNLIGLPVEAYIATKLSAFGSLANVAAGGGYQYLSSPQSAEDAATAVTGPKGASLPEHKGGLPQLPKLSGQLPKLPKLPKPGEKPEAGKGASSSVAGSIPWGLMDDFIAPLWKVTKPVVGMIPNRLKAAAAIGGAAYEGLGFWNRMEPYRNAPPPKPKQKETAR